MGDMELLRVGGRSGETQGVLRAHGIVFAVTLEPPDYGPHPCIPADSYLCKRVDSPKFGKGVWEVTGVPGREHILFHKGNRTEDTLGCILVGEKFVGEAIGESKEGYDEFMSMTNGLTEFWLSVMDVDKYLPTTREGT